MNEINLGVDVGLSGLVVIGFAIGFMCWIMDFCFGLVFRICNSRSGRININ